MSPPLTEVGLGSSPVPGAADLARGWATRPGRAVLFDFNGTLSDDEPIIEAVYAELFAEHLGWQLTSSEYAVRLVGLSDREIVTRVVAEHGTGDPALVERLLAVRGERYREVVAVRSPIGSGARALVRRLHSAGVPMAVVTGAQRADVETVLARSEVGPYLRGVVAEEDVSRGKPDPEGFLLGAALLERSPADVLVFEDSAPGAEAAARAGMACIRVTRPLDVDLLQGTGI
ncbi:HAD-IA family hydrolase [Nocardioides flavescens]|uniref:HAD-IA family hydrolase n=1 Tax=Nocardioides flavescens TaxID=2691959 RepID=A0A6L7EUV4_9ACTN|nr:HAD-IA family hydrolase [Nocardioides flavescens]